MADDLIEQPTTMCQTCGQREASEESPRSTANGALLYCAECLEERNGLHAEFRAAGDDLIALIELGSDG